MLDLDMKFWAGSEASFAAYLLTLRKLIASGDFEKMAGIGAPAEMQGEPPRLFSKHGDVGVIKIAGPLVNNAAYWNRYYGMTGYPEIREALIYAVKEGGVKSLILDIASGGGAVAGVFDTATLIAKIDKSVMPVHTFSDASIMSAAYLLGSAARTVNVGPMTEAGSVGVLMVHQEMSKLFAEMGIKPTVLRAGKYKALGNPYEPLTELAKQEYQAQLDYMYDAFVAHVAEHRSTSKPVADEKMAQGRVFVGGQSVDVGLADEVMGYDALVSRLQAKSDKAGQKTGITTGIATNQKLPKYAAEIAQGNSMPSALTEQDLAAMQEGAPAAATAPATGAAPAETPATTQPAAQAPATEHGGGSGGAPAAAAPAAPAAAQPAAQATDLTSYLQNQLAAAQARVTELTMEAAGHKAAADKANQAVASMRPIVEGSVNRLRVAMGQSGTVDPSASVETLVAEQESLRKQFEAKFKAGGVAAVSATDTSDKSSVVQNDPLKQARLAATRAQ